MFSNQTDLLIDASFPQPALIVEDLLNLTRSK